MRWYIIKIIRTIHGNIKQILADDGRWYIAVSSHGFATRRSALEFWQSSGDGSADVFLENTKGKRYKV